MWPEINIFGIEIASYGLMNLIGFGFGIMIASFRAGKRGITFEQEFLMLVHVCIGVIIGAKILFLLISLDEIWAQRTLLFQDLGTLISYLRGGFVFYGGLIGGIATAYLYCRHYREPFLKMLEIAVPSIPLVHAFGRIGCFLAGCCYGIPSDWLGISFSHSPYAPNGISLFPVQLMEAGINFALFIVLIAYGRKERRPYRILGLYLTCYAAGRFILEYFRYDSVRGIFFGLSTSQWISMVILACGLYFILIKGRNRKKSI